MKLKLLERNGNWKNKKEVKLKLVNWWQRFACIQQQVADPRQALRASPWSLQVPVDDPYELGTRAQCLIEALELKPRHVKRLQKCFKAIDFTSMGDISYTGMLVLPLRCCGLVD